MIINGVKAGKQLRGAKFDMSTVWSRRSDVLNDSDSIHAVKLSAERDVNFVYMLVYNPDSVKENQLLFELAKYNFASYLVRNFEIQVEEAEGMHRMLVRGFQNYDEALQYARHLHRQEAIGRLTKKARPFIISEQNMPLLGRQFSYDDYALFYQKHFAPLRISTLQLLTEPVPSTIKPTGKPATAEEIDRELERISQQDKDYYPVEPVSKPAEKPKPAQQSQSQKPQTEPQKPRKPTPVKKPATPVKPVKPLDLDDEYYDLDGF